jgi:glycosyltransferase involved in cell wall biosynthesis
MSKNALTISIVIPAYNEERHLKACLDAIVAQTAAPDDVVVVDNNSTDRTAAIAAEYPFVRVIKESRQGRGYARTAGFNAVTTDVIGRIDADSVIAPNWIERVLADMQDTSVAALTGLGRTNIAPFMPWLFSTFLSRMYFWDIHAYFNTNTMWGANSAIRRSNWLAVRDAVCLDDRQCHEDQDMSLLIAGKGGKIIQDNQLLIRTHGVSYAFFPKLVYYCVLRHRTRRLHTQLSTLKQPGAQLLGFWDTLPGRVMAIVPGMVFAVVSFILWPVYAVILAHKRQLGKPWLD